jgi:8-oxo-dGTP diphosphatase
MHKIVPAVKGLILDKNRFLVIKCQWTTEIGDRVTYWDLPGGKPEYGENPYNALVREIKEETDLDVSIQNAIGMFWFFCSDKSERVCTVFSCKPKTVDVLIDKNPAKNEVLIEYRWVTKDEFLKKEHNVLHDSLKELVEKYL